MGFWETMVYALILIVVNGSIARSVENKEESERYQQFSMFLWTHNKVRWMMHFPLFTGLLAALLISDVVELFSHSVFLSAIVALLGVPLYVVIENMLLEKDMQRLGFTEE